MNVGNGQTLTHQIGTKVLALNEALGHDALIAVHILFHTRHRFAADQFIKRIGRHLPAAIGLPRSVIAQLF